MTEYLTSELCPAMEIAPIFDEVALPSYGVKSTLLLVTPTRGAPFVMRCIRDATEAQTLVGLIELATEKELPTPRIRFSDVGKAHFRKHGFGVVVEELIEGEHLKPGALAESDIECVGRGLARLHSVRAMAWGPPGRTRSGNFFDPMILGKVENRLASVAKFDPDFEKPWKDRIVKFVRSFRKEWNAGPPYALTHDKINTGNILFTAEDHVQFLDLISIRYGDPGKDLAAALYYFCDGEGEEACLKASYFKSMGAESGEAFDRLEPLYRAWHHLGRWASKSRALHKKEAKGLAEELDDVRRSQRRERDATFAWIDKAEGG